MVQILPAPKNDVVMTVMSGQIDSADMDKLLSALEAAIERAGEVSWYCELRDFKGWTMKGFWKDLSFGVAHAADFKKIAMVGEKQWEKWMTELMKPFTTAEVRFFDPHVSSEAAAWINE